MQSDIDRDLDQHQQDQQRQRRTTQHHYEAAEQDHHMQDHNASVWSCHLRRGRAVLVFPLAHIVLEKETP